MTTDDSEPREVRPKGKTDKPDEYADMNVGPLAGFNLADYEEPAFTLRWKAELALRRSDLEKCQRLRAEADALNPRLARELTEVKESWGFSASSYVFRRNCQECLDYLWRIEHDPEGVLPLAGDRERQREISREVVRLLTNCAGAAYSLKSAVNGMYRRLHKDGSFPEFEEQRRARYDTDPVIQFVLRLRHYLVHVGPIGVTFTFQMPEPTDPSGFRVEIGFDFEGLLMAAKRWERRDPGTPAAKHYLKDLAEQPAGERRTLFQHLLEFWVRMNDFYKWFAECENTLQRERLNPGAR